MFDLKGARTVIFDYRSQPVNIYCRPPDQDDASLEQQIKVIAFLIASVIVQSNQQGSLEIRIFNK